MGQHGTQLNARFVFSVAGNWVLHMYVCACACVFVSAILPWHMGVRERSKCIIRIGINWLRYIRIIERLNDTYFFIYIYLINDESCLEGENRTGDLTKYWYQPRKSKTPFVDVWDPHKSCKIDSDYLNMYMRLCSLYLIFCCLLFSYGILQCIAPQYHTHSLRLCWGYM